MNTSCLLPFMIFFYSKDEDNMSSNASESSTKLYDWAKYSSIRSRSSCAPSKILRMSSMILIRVELQRLLLEALTRWIYLDKIWLTEVDLFASQTNMSASDSSIVDPFAIPNPVVQPEIKASKSAPEDANIVDPFTAVLLNDFNGSDFFNAFTHSDSVSSENSHNGINDGSDNNLGGKSSVDSSTPLKKDAFQVKSGIWADSLSRGLIDLKLVSLADIGAVGGLSDGFGEREKGPLIIYYTGRAMGVGSGLGRSGFSSSPSMGWHEFFSNFGGQQHQYGGGFLK